MDCQQFGVTIRIRGNRPVLNKAEHSPQKKGKESHFKEFKYFNLNRSEFGNITIIEKELQRTQGGERRHDALLIVQVPDDENLQLDSGTQSKVLLHVIE